MVYSSKRGGNLQNGKITRFWMPGLAEFPFQIKYTEIERRSHHHETDMHTHREFEIYVNLAGDVSFLVENTLYPLSHGDVIIARPGEHHHCVYRSDAPHKFFWILFDYESNSTLLDLLQKDISGNFISPNESAKEELIELCSALHSDPLSNEEKLYSFLRILKILKDSQKSAGAGQSQTPREIGDIIDYINEHICEDVKITDICQALYISQSTVERRFKEYLDMSPVEFIRQKKIFLAAEMLKKGDSVLTAGTAVGYADNSHFIKLFKRYYGVTPHQYKKRG